MIAPPYMIGVFRPIELLELHFAELIVLGNLVRWGFFYHSQEGSVWYLWSSSQTQAAVSNGDSMHDWGVVDSCPSSHSEWKPEPSISLILLYEFLFWILTFIFIQQFGLFYLHPPYAATRRKLSCCYQIANKVGILDRSPRNPSDTAIQRKICRTDLKGKAESKH